mmetsp:Transcript_61860/g.177414  ORF Transcript_61860/g.177414 Transcript_61860/m.177414 type:complete len:381 (+) Transcript_61860:973-2115(+)
MLLLIKGDVEWVVTDQKQVQHHSDTPHVASADDGATPGVDRQFRAHRRALDRRIQLRGRVPQGACAGGGQPGPGRRTRGRRHGRPAEVSNLELAVAVADRNIVQHHILRLDVLMLDTALSEVLQGEQQLSDQAHNQLLGEPSIPMLSSVKIVHRRPVAILKDEHVLTIEALVTLHQPQDVRMDADMVQRVQLLLERLAAHSVKALDGHAAAPLAEALRHRQAAAAAPQRRRVQLGAPHATRRSTRVARRQRFCQIDLRRHAVAKHGAQRVAAAPTCAWTSVGLAARGGGGGRRLRAGGAHHGGLEGGEVEGEDWLLMFPLPPSGRGRRALWRCTTRVGGLEAIPRVCTGLAARLAHGAAQTMPATSPVQRHTPRWAGDVP